MPIESVLTAPLPGVIDCAVLACSGVAQRRLQEQKNMFVVFGYIIEPRNVAQSVR